MASPLCFTSIKTFCEHCTKPLDRCCCSKTASSKCAITRVRANNQSIINNAHQEYFYLLWRKSRRLAVLYAAPLVSLSRRVPFRNVWIFKIKNFLQGTRSNLLQGTGGSLTGVISKTKCRKALSTKLRKTAMSRQVLLSYVWLDNCNNTAPTHPIIIITSTYSYIRTQ